jgi:organic hydroperoxide reductase OsmC/OhrA
MADWTIGLLPIGDQVGGRETEDYPPGGRGHRRRNRPGITHGMLGLAARLNISLPGIEHQIARELVDAAHEVCPYSRATRGNVDVVLTR